MQMGTDKNEIRRLQARLWSAQARLRFGTTRHVVAVQTLVIKIGLELG
jgi:hypothetical protein